MQRKYDGVLFDFDGTIADSAEGVFASISYALEQMGLPLLDEEKLRTFIGPPLYVSFEQQCGVDETMNRKLIEKYREYYNETGIYKLRIYDGVFDLIEKLRQHSVKTGIASSKPEVYLKKIAEFKNFSNSFDIISGSDPDYIDSSKKAIIERAADELRAQGAQRVLMVGDRCFDIEGAHDCALECVGVLYGYGTKQEFTQYGADYIVSHPKEIEKIVF